MFSRAFEVFVKRNRGEKIHHHREDDDVAVESTSSTDYSGRYLNCVLILFFLLYVCYSFI